MKDAIANYYRALTQRVGESWNAFWFRPSDPATTSALRVLVGAFLVYTHLTLSADLERFFDPRGIVSLAAIEQLAGGQSLPSYFNYLRGSTELWAGHVVGLVVLALFAAGLWTRVTSVLALVVVLSYIHRVPQFTTPAELITPMLTLYLCLGPCGRHWSVDAWLRGRKKSPVNLAAPMPADSPSLAATISRRLIQVHLCLIYVMMVAAQLSRDVWWDGSSVWYMGIADPLPGPDFHWLKEHEYFMNFWSHGILLLEAALPILVWNATLRPLVLALSALAWASVALVSGFTTLAAIMAIANLAFVSPEAWRAVLRVRTTPMAV